MPETTVRPSLAELEATLQDQAQVTTLINEGRFGDFVRDYVEARTEQAGNIQQQVEEQTQRVLGEWLRDQQGQAANVRRVNLDPNSPVAGRNARRQGLHSRRSPGARVDAYLDEQQLDTEDYLRSIWYRNQAPAAVALRDRLTGIRNDFGSTVPADGGFLIPERLRSELLSIALETAIVRPRARVIPMDSLRVPFPTIDDTSHASSVYGGMIGYWTEEGGALTESQASFGRVVLDAKKLTGYSEVPNELFQDAIGSFAALVEQLWPEAIAFFEDDAFINGSGVGEPLGFLNGSAVISVSRVTADLIDWPDVVAMYSRMLPASLQRAVWLCAPDALPEIFTMTQTVENVAGSENVGGSAVYIQNGTQGPPMTILGRPLIVSEKIPKLTDPNALTFVDLGYYLLGDRQAMQFETSPHYKFANDQTAVRIIERVDGRPWLSSALTPKNGSSNTLSPFVGLST
jgi:HK97 family phage major capsid protein